MFFKDLISTYTSLDVFMPELKDVFTTGNIFELTESYFNRVVTECEAWGEYIKSIDRNQIIESLAMASNRNDCLVSNVKKFISIYGKELEGRSEYLAMMKTWLQHSRRDIAGIAHQYAAAHPEWSRELLLDQLDTKKAEERTKAVNTLSKNLSPAIRARFESLLPKEKSDEVRLELYKALDPLWMSEGRNFSRADMTERMSQVSKRLAKPVAPWLDETALPPLPLKDGSAMSVEEVRHLCSSLALMPELDIHPEARPWFDLICDDRKASGPFALALLKAYLSSKVEPKFRFALGLAGRLGDEAILPILNAQVDAWAKGSRGKMAEYAAAAIALQGSEMALMITDDIAQRYRSKNANIGSAAREAMQEVATARGLSIDQLGDAIIPWLGFVPGQPRLIPSPKGDNEVRIGAEGKLAYLIDGKLKSTAPAGISADTKAELKTLAAQLRAVLKAQKARHNRMLVQERRWPLSDWQKLYLSHPALRPFLVHQIWGLWNEQNQLIASFRQEEDGSFVSADESAFALPASGSVGLIHPLHLDGDAHHEWKQHLAAAGIKPLVPQLERPLRLVSESEKGLTEGDWVRGVKLGGMTFKGRADRLGWIRGSVVDGGGIESYRKPFPEAGVEALLTDLDGMYIGIDPESQISLGCVCFIKLGSVLFGSYTYDTPGKGDSRLLSFSQVPPIVFSEAVSDALLIAGKTVEEEEED